MRILFIAHYFQPEPNFFFGLPFAKELAGRGHNVEVLTGYPNYPEGKIYDGYKQRFIQKEVMDGVKVVRVPLYPSHNKSSIKRILSYSSLSASQALLGPWVMKKADVAYVAQGPATIAVPAIALRIFRRIPYVLDIKDLWPDSLLATGMFNSRLGLKIIGTWCRLMYKYAAKIVVPTPGIKKTLVDRGINGNKIELIHNWCDDALICRADKNVELARSLNMDGKFNIVFAGNIGKAQSLEAVINAAKMLATQYKDIQFVFVGAGIEVEKLKQKAKSLSLSNIIFHPRKPISEIGPILRLADVLLVHLRDEPLFRITIPSKTQAYMAIGRPILMGIKGDAADIVEKAGAGIVCEPENTKSIVDAVEQIYLMSPSERNKMGERGIGYYEKNLSFSIAVDKYERSFECIAGKK